MSALQNQYKQEENGEKYLRCCKKKKKKTQFRTLRPETQVALMVKYLPASAGEVNRCGFDPWIGKFPWRRAW